MKHECRDIEGRLVDLVFDEVDGAQRAWLLAEVEGCAGCRENYRAMAEAIRGFDRAAEAAAPAESYWAGHETRLRARLDEAARPGVWARLAGWLTWRPTLGVSLSAAALLLGALALGWWASYRRTESAGDAPVVVRTTLTPTPEPPVGSGPGGQSKEPKPGASQAPRRKRVPPTPRPAAPAAEPMTAPIMARAEVPFFGPETVRHLEKAQRLLRSFRNARPLVGEPGYDLAYEKKQSRELVYQNMLLRRDAEAKGNLPAEELLGSLEPLLLDIANLGDRPAPDEIGAIRERLQNKEIIARLQVYAAPPALVSYREN